MRSAGAELSARAETTCDPVQALGEDISGGLSCAARPCGGSMIHEVVVVMLVVPVRDFAASRQPDVGARRDVLEHVMEGGDAMGMPDNKRVKRHAQHHAIILSLFVQLIERGFYHCRPTIGRITTIAHYPDVVDLG